MCIRDRLWTHQCASLRAAGLIEGDDTDAQARDAHARLRAAGWSDEALRSGALSVGFDLWRAVAVTYASAYGRYGVGEHPCGYAFALQNPDAVSYTHLDVYKRQHWHRRPGGAGAGRGCRPARGR